MQFLGYSFLGGKFSLDPTITNVKDINSIKLKNQICDDMYVTKDISSISSPLNSEWNFDTLLHAAFQGDCAAGNVGYALSSVSSVRVKIREFGKYNWVTIHEVPVSKAEDLTFDYYTNLCRGGDTNYEIAIVPIVNGAEGNYNINTVVSSFDGLFICEKGQYFGTNLDVVVTPTRNRPSSVINPLTGQYPIVIYNTQQNYDSGTIQATYVMKNENGEYLKSTAYQYRNDLKDFLFNGQPKLIKCYDGRIWLSGISNNITEDVSNYNAEGYTKVTFTYTEIGDWSDGQDLYDNDIIDVNPSET